MVERVVHNPVADLNPAMGGKRAAGDAHHQSSRNCIPSQTDGKGEGTWDALVVCARNQCSLVKSSSVFSQFCFIERLFALNWDFIDTSEYVGERRSSMQAFGNEDMENCAAYAPIWCGACVIIQYAPSRGGYFGPLGPRGWVFPWQSGCNQRQKGGPIIIQ